MGLPCLILTLSLRCISFYTKDDTHSGAYHTLYEKEMRCSQQCE